MKRFAVLSLFVALLCAAASPVWGAVAINEINFPDEAFRNHISTKYDTESSMKGTLSDREISFVTSISVPRGVANLEGIKYFTSLKNLFLQLDSGCYTIVSVDVSDMTSLESLILGDARKLVTLNVNGCKGLKTLEGRYVDTLPTLDASNLTALETFEIGSAPNLASLNVSGCTKLKRMTLGYTKKLTALDVSNLTALTRLTCSGSIADSKLATLNIRGCTALEELDCSKNKITQLVASDSKALKTLTCNDNSLTSLVVRGCSALEKLYCQKNSIAALDVTGCTALERLECDHNELVTLEFDAGGHPALRYLKCEYNTQNSYKRCMKRQKILTKLDNKAFYCVCTYNF